MKLNEKLLKVAKAQNDQRLKSYTSGTTVNGIPSRFVVFIKGPRYYDIDQNGQESPKKPGDYFSVYAGVEVTEEAIFGYKIYFCTSKSSARNLADKIAADKGLEIIDMSFRSASNSDNFTPEPSYAKYGGYNGYDDDAIDEAFNGDPGLTWNVE